VQVGEFAFVLLSLASQLGLINNRLAMLLLGITAISLLTTPLVLSVTMYILNPETSLPYTSIGGNTLHSSSLKHSRSLLSEDDVHVDQPQTSDPIPEADIRKAHARYSRPASGPTMEGVSQHKDSTGWRGTSSRRASPLRGDSQRQVHSRRASQSGSAARHPF
jgi:hypothetical protein